MTPHTPAEQSSPALPTVHSSRRRWALVLLAVVLLAGGIGGAWRWFHRPTMHLVPPLPGDIQDAEVRQAVEHARQAVLDKPGDAYAWGYLGMTLEAHLYEAEADSCFAEAARLDPTDVRWPYFRGLYALKYEPDKAVRLLQQAAAVQTRPEEVTAVRLRLAEALLERQQLDEAAELFQLEADRQPDNARAAFGLGLIAVKRGDAVAAQKWLTVAQASATARRPATAQLAALARARHDEAATARLEKEAAPRPSDTFAWPDPLVEQIIHLRVGPDVRAEELAHRVADLERRGQYREAAQVYVKQIREQPTAEACVGAGRNLARAGEYEQALPYLRQAVRLDSNSVQAHFTLAWAQFARAEKDWARSPGSSRAREWFTETVEQAQQTAALKPDHALNYLYWGLALKYLGQPKAAEEPLRKGVACQPADEDLQLALGEVLLALGCTEEAATYLENARKLEPTDPRVTQALERLRKQKE